RAVCCAGPRRSGSLHACADLGAHSCDERDHLVGNCDCDRTARMHRCCVRRSPEQSGLTVRGVRTFVAISMAALSASCATTPDEPNDLCDHMAAFANAAANDGTHTVRLMTDWGGYYARLKDPSD